MERISTEGLRKRHTTTSSTENEMPKKVTFELPTSSSSGNAIAMDDYPLVLNPEGLLPSAELPATPFPTRGGSPVHQAVMPHTVAQAEKFMSDLNAAVDKGATTTHTNANGITVNDIPVQKKTLIIHKNGPVAVIFSLGLGSLISIFSCNYKVRPSSLVMGRRCCVFGLMRCSTSTRWGLR